METVVKILYYTIILSQIFIFHSKVFVIATEQVSIPTQNINNIDGIVPFLKTSIKTNITYYAGYGVLIHPRMVIGIPENNTKGYRYSIGTFDWTLNTAHINVNHRYRITYRMKTKINTGVIHYKYLQPTDQWTDHFTLNYVKNLNIIILQKPISGISPVRTLPTIQLNGAIYNNNNDSQCVRMEIIKTSNSNVFTAQTIPQKIFMNELELKNLQNHSVFSEATDKYRIIQYFFNDGYYFLSTKDQQFHERERQYLMGSLLMCPSESDPEDFVLAGILIDIIDGFPLYDFISQDKNIQDQLDVVEGRPPNFDDNEVIKSTLRSYISQFYSGNYE